MALEPGRGRSAVPVRTTIGAAVIGITCVMAALTFGAGLTHLVATPPLYGWNWDVIVPLPVVGAVTMRKLHVSIGDTVTATRAGVRRALKIVGRVVLPGLGNYPGADKTAIGEGAVFTFAGLNDLGPRFGISLLVRFAPGTTVAGGAETLRSKLDALPRPESVDPPTVTRVQRPSDVSNYARVRATPIGLAAILGILSIAAVAHVLGAAVRRRSRDLAVLKTLGMVRRQIRATVAWQSSAVALVALAVGIPAGIATGRWAWSAFASQLGTVAEPRVPVILALLALPAVVAACNLVAAVPARRAARTRPALVLRSE
jgi:hypothetical protein